MNCDKLSLKRNTFLVVVKLTKFKSFRNPLVTETLFCLFNE